MKLAYATILMLFSKIVLAQGIELEITQLQIFELKKVESNEISSHDNEGPYLVFKCVIQNNSNEPISFNPSKAKFLLKYTYDSEVYLKKMFPLAFMDNSLVVLAPKEKVDFEISDKIFLGTPVFSVDKNDYKEDLLQILPTMEVIYREKDIYLRTCKALDVSLN